MTTESLIELVSECQTYENPLVLGRKGSHGKCYKISEESAAKIPREYIQISIGREMKIAKMLYEAGISVPKPLAWDFISVPQEYQEPQMAFIMEYVPGWDCYSLSRKFGKEYEEFAFELAQHEITKANELGFIPGLDALTPLNLILSSNFEIKLIDFGNWGHKDVPNYVDPETVFRSQK
jgi:RIO-like serine/threonine protein kinase